MTAHRTSSAPDGANARPTHTGSRPPAHREPPVPSVRDLLAAGAAATAVSTPPSAPEAAEETHCAGHGCDAA